MYESVLKDAHSWGPVWSKCVLAFLEYEKAALEDSRLLFYLLFFVIEIIARESGI